MKKVFYTLFILLLISNVAYLQKGKKAKGEVDPYAAFQEELNDYKKSSRIALKPYRYDGAKTTFFTYKNFDYIKEVEVATIQDADYRLSFNANGIHYDKIKIRIYDRPEGYKGRILLYEKDGVGANEFTCETDKMVETLKAAKREKGVSENIVKQMQLKKIYIDYIIPAVERETEIDAVTGKEVSVVKKGAMVLSIGYENLAID